MTETLVTGRRIRKGGSDVYDDLLPEGVRLVGFPPEGLLFDGELTAEQVVAIRDRMESVDDVDQAERARIAAALDGGAVNIAEMLAERALGRPVREPVFPELVENPGTEVPGPDTGEPASYVASRGLIGRRR